VQECIPHHAQSANNRLAIANFSRNVTRENVAMYGANR